MSKDPLPYATPESRPAASIASQIFGVIVRTVGLLLALYGLYMLLIAATAIIGMSYEGSLTPETYAVHGVFWVGVGAALPRCKWLLWFAYGRQA